MAHSPHKGNLRRDNERTWVLLRRILSFDVGTSSSLSGRVCPCGLEPLCEDTMEMMDLPIR